MVRCQRHAVTSPEHIKFAIIGANPSERVTALETDRVSVLGFVDDPYPALKGALAVVAPMQLGRGIQNKVLEAMDIAGLCIVSKAASKAFKGAERVKGRCWLQINRRSMPT